MTRITGIQGREILDALGRPTVEVDVHLNCGVMGRASVPTGPSSGEDAASALHDNEPGRYGGQGVSKAVLNVNEEIAEELLGMDALDQRDIDILMCRLDGTPGKSRLGSNAILGVSLAVARAAAAAVDIPLYRYLGGVNAHVLPVPMMNVLSGGGTHSEGALAVQEFMVVPVGARTFSDAVQMGAEVLHALEGVLQAQGSGGMLSDDRGYALPTASNGEAIEAILKAIASAGYRAGDDVWLALAGATNTQYRQGDYRARPEKKAKTRRPRAASAAKKSKSAKPSGGLALTSESMVDLWKEWVDKYPIISIEDPLARTDWTGWISVTRELGDRIQLVGDGVFSTNAERLTKGISEGVANSILLKLNEIGTLTEALDIVEMAQRAGYTAVISHRTGDTEDAFIADVAVAANAGQVKAGSVCRGERTAKYNQLLRIDEELQDQAEFLGMEAFSNLSKA